jgi:lactate permease
MWTQVYQPTDSLLISTLLAGLPILLLLGLLATGRFHAHVAALLGLAAAVVIAVFFYAPQVHGGPTAGERVSVVEWAPSVLAAAVYGACFGLLPIGWIVLNAIFLYALTVETGQFEIVKHSVASLSEDRRIQALLIAFSFGAFVEGAAGFGTPVAISGALLLGAGFRPLPAAGLALLANTAPVAFGSLGTPIVTLAQVTGLDLHDLSAMAGRQLPFFSLLVPVWLVWAMSGWRGVVGVWPALLICAGTFALVQFLVSNLHGPWLVDVAGGLISLASLAVFLRFWQPRQIWRFPGEEPAAAPATPAAAIPTEMSGAMGLEEPVVLSTATGKTAAFTSWQLISAWVPWLLLSAFVFLWGVPQFREFVGYADKKYEGRFDSSKERVWVQPTLVSVKVPFLHRVIARDVPVVPQREEEKAMYHFNWLSASGSSIFLAALASAAWLRVAPGRVVRIFLHTCYRVRWALFTIACMLAIAFVTRYSGMDASLGLVFKEYTRELYPLFAALLGWLGVALTGSDTSSNALFGSLQTMTARQLVTEGILPLDQHQAQVLLATANSTGGVMGKMIDAQSIVVASTATGQTGQEGAILRYVFWHSLVLAILMGLLVLFQAYVWTASIP